MKRMLLIVILVAVSNVMAIFTAVHADDTTSTPTPAIYDTLADTRVQISDAVAAAKESGKHVLIQWGANWCVWCRLLHGMFESDSLINAELEANYVRVLADVGVTGKNADLMAQFGVERKQGIPFLTVLNSEGKLIANQETGSLETGAKDVKGHSPEKVLTFLRAHAPQ